MASLLLEQQEKLRRHVDEWRFRSHATLAALHPAAEPFPSSLFPSSSASASSDPIRLHVVPTEHAAGSASLLSAASAADDNVAVSKFVAVLSHGCLEISRLCDAASRNLYKQLLLFGHHTGGPSEALLEGEPQKAFACSLPLFVEMYEIVNAMTMVLGNLLRQLDAIYSLRDKNVRPLNSFKSFDFRTVFSSFGQGLVVFLVLDEILRQNANVRSYLSLFARMLSKVKTEVDIFGMPLEDVDFLDQVICNLQKLFDIGFFQRLMQAESPLYSSISLVRSNKKLLDAFSSCFYESMSEILQRIDSLKELPFDRRSILHLLALFLFITLSTAEAPDKKLGKLLVEIFQLVPVIYIEGGKRIILSDLLKSHCSPALSSWPSIREASEVFGVMKSTYLARLNEMHSRDIQVINDALSCWSVSFQSAVHPSSQMLTEEWVRLLQKQILQGVVLADRIHMLVLSMLDLHMLLEVPLRREKAKSLCHMIVSLKVIGDLFHTKGSSLVRSVPHIINIIQSDIEQLILPLKTKLQSEIAKGSQVSKTGFLSSLIRGGTEMDTRLVDSISLVLISLQLLEGGGSSQRQLIFSITMDILHSLGHLDVDVVRVRKLLSKFRILSDFQILIDERTNCSFLYWRKEMIATWLSMVYADACKFHWLQYTLDAFSDGLGLLRLGNVGKTTLQFYEEEIENALRKEVVAPLCRDIETDLRLHVHSTHLKGSVFVNPTKTGVRNLSWYLRMKPLQLPFKFVDVKLLVESYLNFAFYTHSVMSTYDRKIYSEMQQLGELKYGVELEDFHLTVNTMDQDFDLRKIIQNLDLFSKKYSYNIIKQMFIENGPDDQGRKNLRVICVEHVASSVAVCGVRPISAASDSILMFLNQMFIDLHALLQSDVEIDLLKEFNPSENNIITSNGQPTLQEGELKFALAKHGLGDHGFDFLEQVQAVVTKIGNVLGLMIILTVGCSRFASNISQYARRPTYDMSYSASCKRAGFDNDIVAIGKILDAATGNKCESEDRIQPFSFFIASFSQKLQSNELKQTKDFFRIVPSLIGNMVDCRLLQKDKLLRRGHEVKSIVHTYDGFLMGVAFVLKVLDQESLFDELNWFASTKMKLEGGVLPEDSNKKIDKSKGGTALTDLKLWRRPTPSARTEVHKGVDKRVRYRQEIELIECGLKLARTVLS